MTSILIADGDDAVAGQFAELFTGDEWIMNHAPATAGSAAETLRPAPCDEHKPVTAHRRR